MSLFLSACNLHEYKSGSETSLIDLSEEQFDDNTIYHLDGKWEFYWDTLLTPQALENCDISPQLVTLPSTWTGLGANSTGVATYRIKLKVPPNKYYALGLKRVNLAHKIWINGKFYREVGKVSRDPDEYIPCDQPQEYVFPTDTDQIEIVIQIANIKYWKAGINQAVKFGSPQALNHLIFRGLIYEIFTIGSMLIALIFVFIIFIYNKFKIDENFYLVLFLFFQILMILTDGEVILSKILPGLPWIIESKLWYVVAWWRSLFIFLFVASLAKGKGSRIAKKTAIYTAIIFSLITIFSPVNVYTDFLVVYIIYSFLLLFYGIHLLRISLSNDRYLIFTYIGALALVSLGLNDMLVDFSVYKGLYLNQYAMFIFILLEVFHISASNASFFNKNKQFIANTDKNKKVNKELLTVNTFDVESSLQFYTKISGVDKILIFYASNNELYLKHEINSDFDYYKVKQKVDFKAEYAYFSIKYLKNVFEEQKYIYVSPQELHKSTDEYIIDNKLSNLILIPITNNNKLKSIVYIEKNNRPLTATQVYLIKKYNNSLKNVILSTYLYTNLQEINKNLEIQVEEKREKIKHQNEKIDYKNEELNEKIELVEEQLAIQKEVTEEIEHRNLKLNTIYKELEDKNKELDKDKENIKIIENRIYEDVNYVKFLLNILKTEAQDTPFEFYYFYNKPKFVVGGDFMWSKNLGDRFLFAVADSTGHGIPGALMSLFGKKVIDTAVSEIEKSQQAYNSADILNLCRENVKYNLTNKDNKIQDGYDMSFCIFYPETKKLSVATANNPVIIIRDKKVIEIKADRMPVGAYIKEDKFKVTNIQLEKNDAIYLFSDGYIDQYNEGLNKKYYISNFKELLKKISDKQPDEQLKILEETFLKWKGNTRQIDDVCVACFKL